MEEAAVDNCLERVDAGALMPPRIETAVETAADLNHRRRITVRGGWTRRPPRIETAVESWPGMETAAT